jgi:signal peptidase II
LVKFKISNWTFAIIAIAVVVLDQITKRLIVSALKLNETLFSSNPFFNIIHVTNTGAGFSILQGKTLFLSLISFAFIIGVLIFYNKIKMHDRLFFALILGGAIGNFIDRVLVGRVIDFISVSFYTFQWPIFNVADMAISCGIIGLLYVMIVIEKK